MHIDRRTVIEGDIMELAHYVAKDQDGKTARIVLEVE